MTRSARALSAGLRRLAYPIRGRKEARVRRLMVVAGLLVASVATAQTVLTPGTYTMPAGSQVSQVPDGSGTVTVPTPPPPPPPPPAASRCEELRASLGAGFLNCWDFETPEQALLVENARPGQEVVSPHVVHDVTMAASGKASLRMDTVSYNEAKLRCGDRCTEDEILWYAIQSNTRWWSRNIAPDWSKQFGPGDGDIWFQVAIRENQAFYQHFGGDGPKKWIWDVGDRWVDFRAVLRDPLPASAGAGTLIRLVQGDPITLMPNFGTLTVGAEKIAYQGKTVDGGLKIVGRGKENTPPVEHPAGTATHLRHALYAKGCMDLELPASQAFAPLGGYMPETYHSCGVKAGYEGHKRPIKSVAGTMTTDWFVQTGPTSIKAWDDAKKVWVGGCRHNKVRVGDFSDCLLDEPDKWVYYTYRVRVGSFYVPKSNLFKHDSIVQVWRNDKMLTNFHPDLKHPRSDRLTDEECAIADLTKPLLPDGKPRPANASLPDAARCLGGYDIARGTYYTPAGSLSGPASRSDVGGKYGKLWLGMMSWHRKEQLIKGRTFPPVCCHPVVSRWFDDVVFATVPIHPPGLTLEGL